MNSLVRLGIVCFGLAVVATVFTTDSKTGHTKDKLTFPRQILIVRHAEKPPDVAMSVDLSAEGRDRAAALPKLFEKSEKRPTPFAVPDFIFAAKDSGKSHRPVQTVTPLTKQLKLPIDATFSNDDPAKLADELFGNAKYAGKTILISWRHSSIAALAQKLNATGFPENWKDSVFDRVWQITFDEKGKATFVDRPQQLMPGDSAK
ncbi:MAG: histidine phosphatase family protein [Planctomycetes bacterium]|nr:histidine phosphatase family protein [Planctomycetota bacterium]